MKSYRAFTLLFALFAAACSTDNASTAESDSGVEDDATANDDESDNADDDNDDDDDDDAPPDDDASASDSGLTTQPSPDASPNDNMPEDAGIELQFLRSIPYPPSPAPTENPHSAEKAMLGKILFWDEQLSSDDTVACGTCHRPSAGGADPRSALPIAHLPGPDGLVGTNDDVQGSPGVIRCDPSGTQTGVAVQVTGRRAPSYLDAMFNSRLFWDGRTECSKAECPSASAFEDPDNLGTFPIATGGALESQAVGPPLSDVEMACEGRSWADIHAKLRTAVPLAKATDIPVPLAQFIAEHDNSYPALFEVAFGSTQTSALPDEINTRRIAFAIATHERTLRSDQTPYDAFNAGDDTALTPAQIRGLDIFRNKAACDSCHLPPLFADAGFHFTGFYNAFTPKPANPNQPDVVDRGRGEITGKQEDWGSHRTPTLRNVSLREAGGLLHNGGGLGKTLNDVLQTYATGGLRDDPEIAPHIPATIEHIKLTPSEIADLAEFLNVGLLDPRVRDELPPFDRPKLSTE
jgi:cytochrome c peroxidase